MHIRSPSTVLAGQYPNTSRGWQVRHHGVQGTLGVIPDSLVRVRALQEQRGRELVEFGSLRALDRLVQLHRYLADSSNDVRPRISQQAANMIRGCTVASESV